MEDGQEGESSTTIHLAGLYGQHTVNETMRRKKAKSDKSCINS
jgi:hypothetical protein